MTEEQKNPESMVAEYEYLKGQIEALQEGINLIDASIMQIDTTILSLNGVSLLKKDNEILLPVGSDSFLSATITDTKNAIVGIGAAMAIFLRGSKSFEESYASNEKLMMSTKEGGVTS